MSNITYRTLTHICANDVCHCDFRLSIYDCVESVELRIINYIHITLSILSIIIGIVILYQQIIVSGNSLININFYQQSLYRRSYIRPKPLECLLLCAVIFNIFRTIESIILITDVLNHNIIFRSWIFEISWEFGFMGLALYLIGIAQVLVSTNQSLFVNWLPQPLVLDIIGSWIAFSPFITNNILSILSGVYASNNLTLRAETTTRVLYIIWFIHCTVLTFFIIVTGIRFIQSMTNYLIANHHIRQTQLTQYYNVKSNILKTKCMVGLTSICLMGFALFLFLYAILRTRIMLDTKGNIALCIVWNLFGVGNALAFEIMMIIFISRGHKSCQHHRDNSNRDNGNGGNEDGHHHGNGNNNQHNNNSTFLFGNVNNNQPYYGISDHSSDISDDDNHTRFETTSNASSTSFNEEDANNHQDLVYQLQQLNYKSQLEQFQRSSYHS